MKRRHLESFPDLEFVKKTYQALNNYLQLASGTGEGQNFPFDFKAFIDQYSLPVLKAYEVLKILEESKENIEETTDEYNPSTGELLTRKQSWGVIIASAAIDPIWWLFVFWIPIYLNEVYAMDVKSIGIYGWVPYVGAMFGAWFGGLLAQNRIKAGWNTDKTRKLTITLGCLIMLPALLAMANPGGPTTAVIIMAVILFGFQTAIGNVQTLPSDLYGKKAVGTLAGFSGMAAKLGALGLTALVPILTADGNYTPAFVIGASLAVIAMAAVWILIPKVEPLKSVK